MASLSESCPDQNSWCLTLFSSQVPWVFCEGKQERRANLVASCCSQTCHPMNVPTMLLPFEGCIVHSCYQSIIFSWTVGVKRVSFLWPKFQSPSWLHDTYLLVEVGKFQNHGDCGGSPFGGYGLWDHWVAPGEDIIRDVSKNIDFCKVNGVDVVQPVQLGAITSVGSMSENIQSRIW